MIQAFNEQLSKPEFKQRMQHSAAALASAYDMEEALNTGDIMGYKNAEMLGIVNDAIYFRDNGMLDFFKGYYEETAKNVSDETINDLRSQTKDAKTGKSFYDSKTNDEIRQMIQDKSKTLVGNKIHKLLTGLGLIEGTAEFAGGSDAVLLLHTSHLHAHVLGLYNHHDA